MSTADTRMRPGPLDENNWPLFADFFVEGRWARVWYGGKVEWLSE